jgi:hypothetical protein
VDTFRRVDTMSRMARGTGGRRPRRRFCAKEDRGLEVLLHASPTGGARLLWQPAHPRRFRRWGEHVSRERIIRLKQEDGLQPRVRGSVLKALAA